VAWRLGPWAAGVNRCPAAGGRASGGVFAVPLRAAQRVKGVAAAGGALAAAPWQHRLPFDRPLVLRALAPLKLLPPSWRLPLPAAPPPPDHVCSIIGFMVSRLEGSFRELLEDDLTMYPPAKWKVWPPRSKEGQPRACMDCIGQAGHTPPFERAAPRRAHRQAPVPHFTAP
jgi:hypothetical protein